MKLNTSKEQLPEFLRNQTNEQLINSIIDKLTEEEKEYFKLKYEIF
jgi:hypothetical protein